MMKARHRLVAIDNDQHTLDLIREEVESDELEVFTAKHPEEGLRLVEELLPEIVVHDSRLPSPGGMDLTRQILETCPETSVIILSQCYKPECPVEEMKKGAVDYIIKPDFLDRLSVAVAQIVETNEDVGRQARAGDESVLSFASEGIIGRSPLMLAAFKTAYRIAPHFRTALVWCN